MKALITSGGKGTRLRPITHTQNKHLIPIANKPILHYAIEAVAEAGIQEIGIVYNAESDAVPRAIGDGGRWGVRITYIPQEAPLGLAHVVKISQNFIQDEPFIFYLGDNMVVGGVKRFIERFRSDGCNCHLTLARVKDPTRFGVPELRGNRIVRIEESRGIPKVSLPLPEFIFTMPPYSRRSIAFVPAPAESWKFRMPINTFWTTAIRSLFPKLPDGGRIPANPTTF